MSLRLTPTAAQALVRTAQAQMGTVDGKSAVRGRKRQQRAIPPQFVPEVEPGTLLLPYPVSTNSLYATVNGNRVKSKAARLYAEAAGKIARAAYKEPSAARFAVHMIYWPKQGVGLDLGNVEKACLDAMTGIVWHDDSQVDRLTIERRECVAGGAFAVRITEISS